jgi:DNA polymerase-1
VDDVAEYAAEDADITLQIAASLRDKVEKTGQGTLLNGVEYPLIHVLTDMEAAGITIDTDALADISKEMETQVADAVTRIHALAGEQFNIGSPKQLGVILFEKLRLPTGKKTQTGYSTDVSVLESLLGLHPIIEEILRYRQLTKLKSTYVDALPKMVNLRTGRVHTSYNQAVAATGRLSSTDPNLQNIPIRTEAGREIRRAFVPGSPDFVLFSADYSQIELRLAAEISGDEGLLAAFTSGEDIHSSTAMNLFGVPLSEVTPEMRRRAKTTNFGILYGISAFGLAQRLGISNADAKDLIDVYFEKYPMINGYIAKTLAFAKRHGYVETMLGRRRYLLDINNKNRNVRMFAERMAINAPIQGSAADMIKVAMINIHREMKRRTLVSRMLLQVHDELVFEAHRDEVDELRALVIDLMTHALTTRVPIEVESGIGANWLEAH